MTGLSVYSDILTEDQVKGLYQCKLGYPIPDIIDWDEVEFDIKPKTENIEHGLIYSKCLGKRTRKEKLLERVML